MSSSIQRVPPSRGWEQQIRDQLFLVIAAVLAVVALATGLVPWRDLPRIEDGRLLATLTALILSVEVLRASGALDALVRRVLVRFSRARTLTGALVLASGALSAVVTNDVALFVVLPFTIAAAKYSDFRVRNAVILEITAANVLGCLTPIGNPQNLFLLHRSGMTIPGFLRTMLPFVAMSLAFLAVAVWLLEPPRSISRVDAAAPRVAPASAAWGMTGIALVLLSTGKILPPWIPLATIVPAIIPLRRWRWNGASLAIVPLFFFVFIDIAGLAALDFARVFGKVPISPIPRLYLAGALFSQAISNVPAAVLLAPLSQGHWRALLYAVNAGGCGTLLASLANLLGWQIYVHESGRDAVYLGRFYRVSFAFLAALGVAAFLLLRWM